MAIPLTPVKPEGLEEQNKTLDHDDNSTAAPTTACSSSSPSSPSATLPGVSVTTAACSTSSATRPPSPSVSFSAALQTFKLGDKSGGVISRRHSFSLTEPIKANLLRPKLILTEVKDPSEQLSDFGSCVSSSEVSSCEDTDKDDQNDSEGFKSMNERQRNKRMKRKLRLAPDKAEFMKKSNIV